MIDAITHFFNTLALITGSPQLLFIVFIASFSLKLGFLTYLAHRTLQSETSPRPIYFLMLVLLSSLICDITWLLTPFSYYIDFPIYNTFLRIAWAFTIILYQALALFLESLTSQKSSLTLRQKIFFTVSSALFLCYTSIALFNFNCASIVEKSWIELNLGPITSIYCLFFLMLPSVLITVNKLRASSMPRILKKQIKLFILGIILPLWSSDFIQIISLFISPLEKWINTNYIFVNLSNILITYAVFYSMRRIMGLRFLNLKDKIQSTIDINFIDNFKIILNRLSHISNEQELNHVTQEFFKEAFDVPFSKINLYMRSSQPSDQKIVYTSTQNQTISLVETFLNTHKDTICKELRINKIMIYDEVAFSNFYEQQPTRSYILNFLNTINADIFLPIYEKEQLIAYVIIERDARPTLFYTEIEHDEMLIFASYLGNIINLLKKQNIDMLIAQEKELNEELYRKHQEISQYKESIRSFVRSPQQKNIGVLFYKNRLFTFGNQAAKEMLKVNLNTQQGHPVARACKLLAQQVEEYKAGQTSKTTDADGNMLILSGVPNLESNNTIITISYPDIADILKNHIEKLQDPSERDYLLYLETTKSGKLINQLIPGAGEAFLNFKIELLKTALSKKALLLSMPEQDLQATVELLHDISLRETLYTITLQAPCKNVDVAIKLFGINPIFGVTPTERPLLEQLHNTGTLLIKNVHFLDNETQKYLAEFIRYGLFRTFKGDRKESSNVRVICSTDQNLAALAQDGLFSLELFNQLKETALTMPPLATLSQEELESVAQGFTQQELKSSTFKDILTLTDKDKSKLNSQRPTSLHELQKRVRYILEHKSQHPEINAQTQFNPAYGEHNAELTAIARLGKNALKNKEAMTLLWSTFKNQNQIATFLGVNRSSVNRRCQAYNLTMP